MKKLSFGFLLFVVLISGCGSINQTDVIRERNLPDDFTINVYYDATSSGGDKIQKATITFKQGLVVSGRREYHGNVPLYKECVADSASLSWESPSGGECEINYPKFSLSKLELQRESAAWKEKSQEDCMNREICYQLII